MSELSILQNFRDSQLRREPFPYLVIENALPAEIYEKLAAAYPDERFIFAHHRGRRPDEPYLPNTRYDLPAAQVVSDPSLDLGLWRAFVEYHTSQDFLDELIAKLGEAISALYPDLLARLSKASPEGRPRAGIRHFRDAAGECEVALDCQVGINSPVTESPTSVRAAHLDNPIELFAGLFYLRHPDDRSKGGDLEICAWKNPGRRRIGARRLISGEVVEVREVVPYGSNRFALFVNGLDSIHGVTVRDVTPFPRRLVNIIGETYPSVGRLFDDRPYRQDRGILGYLRRALAVRA